MAVVTAAEAAAAPAVALKLWRGEADERTVTEVEAGTEAGAATGGTEAVAKASWLRMSATSNCLPHPASIV